MEDKKITAVEWLYEKMYIHKGLITIEEYNQALQMEKDQLAEKDKEIEMFAIGFAKWIRENGYGYSEKFNLYQKSLINKTIFFYEKELIELYKQSLNK